MLEKARLRLENHWNRWNQSGGKWPNLGRGRSHNYHAYCIKEQSIVEGGRLGWKEMNCNLREGREDEQDRLGVRDVDHSVSLNLYFLIYSSW
jgi:hypothetical protein